ncbi:alpha/beta hydrolase [Aldersonia sp. NBC_00410]|uniref:alpha/beta hydrolase n=1 Tax=Aldersonia sp. NBC_00410 TaxID=2975954 RepID=UPI002251D98B|nr:alpha/beta hydrolase [Aldersonia sp. NBC_00410]MCX5043009.1 alpha/beta hydrolase [Aldersonia sp. NBC_00410]
MTRSGAGWPAVKTQAVLAAAVVVAAVLVATGAGRTVATAAPSGPKFGDCPAEADIDPASGTQCAVVSVPMNYADPHGPTIDVTVSRIRAADPSHRRGSMFVNPGGPGADVLGYWATRAKGLAAEIIDHYDRLAVQPRGLRWSTPLYCDPDPSGAQAGAPDVTAPRTSLRQRCAAAQPGYLDTITTENTARDLDAVRSALGIDRISYWGLSYGTYLGAVYSSLFGDRVDRMILDSNVDPEWVWTELFAQQQSARSDRYHDMFAWIAAHDDAYGLGDNARAVQDTWQDLVEREGGGWYANLAAAPVSIEAPATLPEAIEDIVRDGFTGSREQLEKLRNVVRTFTEGASATVPVLAATSIASYSRASWPVFAAALGALSADPADTDAIRDIVDRMPMDSANSNVLSAVTCNENAIPGRPEMIASALAKFASGGDSLDARADLVRAGLDCAQWDPVTTPVALSGADLRTAPIVLQSRRDGATPYPGGPSMAATLGGSLVTVEGGDHGLFARGNRAVDDAVLTYLDSGTVPIDHADEAPIDPPA